jgi:ABC-type transport system substrate-binding protein/DNA-binding SARP family transcriptional activator/streptogramin lyase
VYCPGRVIEFRVLGPLEAVGPSGAAALVGGKQRLLLAILVLHAGELVARSTIIDALWPEDPPASAAQSVESYVSRIRAALRTAGAAQPFLVSAPGGYRLLRDGNRFDRDAFTELASRARTKLKDGEAREARELAGEALALWHGPALAGISEEHAIRGDAAALEDQRLQTLETRAEAQLRIGDHAPVIAELRAEATRHPERERVHELLMVALYRAGRQADALQVYREARDHLSQELGLEPGASLRELQARILRHDPSLDRRPLDRLPVVAAPASPHERRRGVRRGAVALLAVLLAVAVGGVIRANESPGASAIDRRLRVPALGELAVPSGAPRRAAEIGAVPSDIAAGLGSEWVTSYDDGTLIRIDPATSTVVQTVSVGHGASGVTIGAGDAWVADTLEDRVVRVSGATDKVVQRIPVGQGPRGMAAGEGTIWVANDGSGTVTRIDPLSGTVLGTTRVGASPSAVAVGDGAVWVALQSEGAVARLNAHTGQVVQTIPTGSGPSAITVGSAGIWVANEFESTLSLIDPASDKVMLTRAVTGSPSALAAVGADVWAAGDTAELAILAPSGQTRTVAIASPATALAPDPRGVLVGVQGIGADHRGGTLTARLAGPIDQIDPASCCDLPPDVRPLAYDSLLSFSKSPASPDTLVPDLARTIPAPEDGGRSYTFHLRPGIRYSTGAPVRASDFIRGLEAAAQSSDVEAAYLDALPGAKACPGARSCNLARAMTANNRAATITLHLSHPDPNILFALGLPYFAPKPPGRGIRPATGPYRIARYVAGVLIDFERNPFFHEWSPAAQPAGYPDRILVYSNGNPTSDIDAVLAGRADYTFDTPTASRLRTIQLQYPGLLHTQPLPDTDWLSMDTREAPFNDARVRQALNDAVDRHTVANLYGGLADATPTCQIIPATIPGHRPYCPYNHDLARAREVIAASGTRGDTITVLAEASIGPAFEPAGAYMVGLLRKLGYHARLHVVAATRWNAAINDYSHPAQIATESWIADYPSAAQWITLHLSCGAWRPPTQLSNRSQLCDPEVDRLAARAAGLQVNDPSAADSLWARADRLLTRRAPWVPTVTETETDLVSRRVGDYQYVPTIGALLDQLWVR